MKFEFICDDGVFYTPVNNFLKFIMGTYSNQVRADFASRFQKIPLRAFNNIGTNGRLFVRVDDLLNQTMASYEMSEYERFNEFIDFCKKYIFAVKTIKTINKNTDDSLSDLKKEIQDLKVRINEIAELTYLRLRTIEQKEQKEQKKGFFSKILF